MTSFVNLLFPLRAALSGNANELITLAFILTILVYAAWSTLLFVLRTRQRGRLLRTVAQGARRFQRPAESRTKHELDQLFQAHGELAEVWREFGDSLVSRQRDGREIMYKTEESALYFSEDRIIGQYMNIRYWHTVPSLLVGLGILGTFVGLTFGLVPFSTINFTETSEIQRAIQELLSGVSIAFTTSVWGMLTSILFNGLEKRGLGRLSVEVAALQRALDQLFTLTTQEEIEYRQQDELEQQTQALKSFSTDLADRIKVAMDGIVTQQQSNLQDELRGMQERSEAHAQELIQELHQLGDRIEESMRGVVSDQLTPVLANVRHAVDELRTHKEQSSTEAIQRLVSEFQQSLAGTTLVQLETLAQTAQDITGQLVSLPERMAAMMTQMQSQVDESRSLLEEVSETFKHSFKDTALEHRQAVADIMTHVMEQAATASTLMKQEMEAISNHTESHVQRQVSSVERMLESLSGMFNTAVARQTESIKQLVSHVSQESVAATSAMREQVEGTADVFAQNIGALRDQVEHLLEQQKLQTQETNALIGNSQKILDKGRSLVKEMGDSAEGMQEMLERVQVFSEQLNLGAEQIEQVSRSLLSATQTFSEQNQELTLSNRETLVNVEQSLDHARSLLGEFASKFEVIEGGLTNIFGEVQQGLTAYAVSTRESINQYLSEFSQQLVQAANALAGSIEALEENIDELNESFERHAFGAATGASETGAV